IDTEAEHTAFLLDELDAAIQAEGPDTVAMFIAEPVQNAGGCFQPPAGYWPGVRAICDRYGILLVADEVITGFGRLGEWFASTRFDVAPDAITVAKGLTSAHAPMGAVLVADHVAAPLYEATRTFPHGMTFGGHPLCSAIALKSIEIFEREGVLENVRANEAYLGEQMRTLSRLPIVGDVRGSGYFWAVELVRDAELTRFDADEREELLRVALPPALYQAGLVARGDDRCDTVVQVAPPLVCDRPLLDELVDRLGHTLETVSKHMHIPAA
ncbi:MAG: aminotransferase class III-fold pyridoxal phosphate-dependent enzyme, partial [Actinobacteria bacterium]|nr:aminotransferase class III-fold pyridoxal phosphate-dependent enzyme [Actinomycetota bacterium]